MHGFARPAGPGPRAHAAALLGLLLALLLVLPACSSRYKKLSAGGSMGDVLFYDILGQDRAASYYYDLVRNSHDKETFCYRCGDDPYLVDKNIDALQKLGDVDYTRIEGEAQVVELLTEVLLEDHSPLARAAAASSLARLAAKHPERVGPTVPDRGDTFLAYAQELDRLHGADGRLVRDDAGTRARRDDLVRRLGDLRFPDLLTTKNAVRLFYDRRYLVDATEPSLRTAHEEALSHRLHALTRLALRAAVEDPSKEVRVDAVRGLKVIGDTEAVEGVAGRLEFESDWLVRLEIVEYLGRVGTRTGVKTLVPLLEDADASVRRKARQALTRIAGSDLGWRRSAWEAWARSKDPGIEFAPARPDAQPDDETPAR
jgi:hypothetical protein